MSNPRKNLTGQQFGKLTVTQRVGKNDHGNSLWLCRCSCGRETHVLYQHLTTGAVKSCGCGRRKRIPDTVREDWM